MTDIRRMNVGLTRAKSSLWILGDSRALVQGEFWAKLIEDSRQRDRYTSGNIMAMLSQPGPKVPLPSYPPSTSEPQTQRDVVMTDAPEVPRQSVSTSKPGTPAQQVAPSTPYAQETTAPPPLPYRGTGIGGLNERGEATSVAPRAGGAPVIQSTAGSAGKKRPRENNDDGRSNMKKASHEVSTSPRHKVN